MHGYNYPKELLKSIFERENLLMDGQLTLDKIEKTFN